MSITLGEAIRKVFSFIIGTEDDPHPHGPVLVNTETGEVPEPLTHKDIICKKCGTIMQPMNRVMCDFMRLVIYKCPNCKSISEYQHKVDSDELLRETHVYDNTIDTRSSIISEVEGYINYENFTLDKLWAVCGHLCYPALIKSEFTNETSLIFVKCENNLGLNSVDGFIINAQNVVGEIRVFNDQNISHFYNPYLSHLPHKDFHYMSYPTPRCDALEAVENIRFNHTKDGHNGVYMHKLNIIKDMPLRAIGLEVYVKFYSFGEKFVSNGKMMKFVKGINLKAIILGETDFEVNGEYSIQSMYMNKHTVSSVNRIDITQEEREQFYADIVKFFETYDRYRN